MKKIFRCITNLGTKTKTRNYSIPDLISVVLGIAHHCMAVLSKTATDKQQMVIAFFPTPLPDSLIFLSFPLLLFPFKFKIFFHRSSANHVVITSVVPSWIGVTGEKECEVLFDNLPTDFSFTQQILVGNFWPFDALWDTWREVSPRDDAKRKYSRCSPATVTYAAVLAFQATRVDIHRLSRAKRDTSISDDRDRLSAARQRSDDYVARHKSCVLSLKKGVIDTVSLRPRRGSARWFKRYQSINWRKSFVTSP